MKFTAAIFALLTGFSSIAFAQGSISEAATQRALELMRADQLQAITVVQDVPTGRLLVSAASKPKKLDVTTALPPLSTVKLMVAASWWRHEASDHGATE